MTRPMYKQFRSPQGWYSLLYPANWEHMVVEEIPAFFKPESGGALQFYAFESKVDSFDVNQELENYLKIHGIAYDEEMVAEFENEEGTSIRACEFRIEDREWLAYIIANQKQMLLATYNSDEEIGDETFSDLSNIISSIRFL
ncbi:hypothetical protein EHQ58_14560 [Leptospira ognonensis]|uniref:DUF3805 domain-containing protein n=1 Tax=Leptospira ognonensis TaxID=2484945 RepID=A0A4R9JZ41_9LEPT|nr:hypothetical protein [Leptospira ognonensis]TGL57495.1 hypothetical protein EHQ58_14560 [Leptospira ognonensis]